MLFYLGASNRVFVKRKFYPVVILVLVTMFGNLRIADLRFADLRQV